MKTIRRTLPDRDAIHEAHIKRLMEHILFLHEAGEREKAQYVWREFVRAVSERSPAQVEKMEREQGLK